MVVCSCKAVSDRAVRAAVADGARSVEEVSAACAAASDCGGCWSSLEELIDEHASVPA